MERKLAVAAPAQPEMDDNIFIFELLIASVNVISNAW